MNIIVLASGGGSNAARLIDHFAASDEHRVVLVATDRRAAGVRSVAQERKVPDLYLDPAWRGDPGLLRDTLLAYKPHLLVLAGYLRLVPKEVIEALPGRVVNIHPALLPEFGGPGMYGRHVHEAVVAAGKSRSGITIHLADEVYDRGGILFQAATQLDPEDDAQAVQRKVLALEHRHYPHVVERFLACSEEPSFH